MNPSYSVTVPSGTVSADLSAFPLMVDLADMPANFWGWVRSDGGNIRAYDAADQMIPHDLPSFDYANQRGRLFVRTDLATGVDTVVKVGLLPSDQTLLAATDANGRNAVWADYSVVWVFPSTDNRTGAGHTQVVSAFSSPSEWIRAGYVALTGAPHQGLAIDDDGNVITIDTNYLRRSTVAAINTVLASNAGPLAATGISGVNHLGDGCIIGDELFVPVEEYPNDPYDNQHIAVFDSTTLAFKRSYDISAQGHEVSGIAYDGTNLLVTGYEYEDQDVIYKYTTSGVYVGTIELSQVIDYKQGIVVVDGEYLVSGGLYYVYRVTPAGVVTEILDQSYYSSYAEGLAYYDGNLYVNKGDGEATIYRRLAAQWDCLKLHYQNARVTLPRFQTWTAGASLWWTISNGDAQQGFLSLANGTTSANRATLAYDEGPDKLSIWNSTDGWLASSVNPDGYTDWRLAFQQDGTTQRRLFIDGAAAGTDNTISARPTGTGSTMELVVNASDLGDSEDGEGYYQYVWLRDEYLSADWLAADADNFNAPSEFYSVAYLGGSFGVRRPRIFFINT